MPVIEDAPYGELCFEGEPLPPVASFDEAGLVILLGTFSKTLSPGMRLGWVVGESSLVRRYALVKQGVDLHTSSLTQLLAARFVAEYDLEAHIAHISGVYRRRRVAVAADREDQISA